MSNFDEVNSNFDEVRSCLDKVTFSLEDVMSRFDVVILIENVFSWSPDWLSSGVVSAVEALTTIWNEERWRNEMYNLDLQ